MPGSPDGDTDAVVHLYWIPLGTGQRVVRFSGRAFEAISSMIQRRDRRDLYHSALVVNVPDGRYSIEMAPTPDAHGERRGVVAHGPVGIGWAGRLRIFRYEIRRWKEGVIPDLGAALGILSIDLDQVGALRLLDLVPSVPTPVWGRDELDAGEMWNSNSVVSWLLARCGVDMAGIALPPGGRAPGWDAGIVVAGRDVSR